MTLNYPVYNLRTGARLTLGPPSGAYGGTYGAPIFTGPELLHVAQYFKARGFHVYANKAFGGVNLTAHSAKSWHYARDANGVSLGFDMGTFGDVNERNRIINEAIPVLNALGMGWHYARDGYVPAHDNHIHVDVSNWGRRGGSEASGYGQFVAARRRDPFTYLGGAIARRTPRTCAAYYGMSGTLVRIVQRIAKAKVDGSYGPGTVKAVRALQKRLGVTQDGNFGPITARTYFTSVGTRRQGTTGFTVQLIQHVAGITVDGSYGPATTKAVKEMQTWAGITADGIFGPTSRQRLLI